MGRGGIGCNSFLPSRTIGSIGTLGIIFLTEREGTLPTRERDGEGRMGCKSFVALRTIGPIGTMSTIGKLGIIFLTEREGTLPTRERNGMGRGGWDADHSSFSAF